MDTVKVDSAKRVRLPDAKPGQVFAYSADGHGRIVLLEVRTKAGKPDKSFLGGLKPLSKTILEKLYRNRQDDEEGIRVLADAQAWNSKLRRRHERLGSWPIISSSSSPAFSIV